MTWSIIAKAPDTGAYGVAVATRSLAVGGLVPHGAGRIGAIAAQARVNPLWGVDGLRFLAEGRSAHEVVEIVTRADEGRAKRQLHVIDARGQVFAHTGGDCVGWAGHAAGDGVSVAGNMLTGPAVVQATLRAFQEKAALPFAERLIAALDAGQAAGGDKRGRQSAAIKVWGGEPYPILDLRTDDHPEPLAELRRLYDLAQDRYVAIAAAMATRMNPFGVYDTAERDRMIAAHLGKRPGGGA
ncbi:MAG: DUF1028 domain-containing protein [Alphaproteobacteria bacterium]|nr:DUF1028 domain-containing protein [Alphaproteobacteria bacterium]